jgi:hypothetical protein
MALKTARDQCSELYALVLRGVVDREPHAMDMFQRIGGEIPFKFANRPIIAFPAA